MKTLRGRASTGPNGYHAPLSSGDDDRGGLTTKTPAGGWGQCWHLHRIDLFPDEFDCGHGSARIAVKPAPAITNTVSAGPAR